MTMMSSLKAFLFASPAQGAMTGAAAIASAGPDEGAFAALLGGITQPSVTPSLDGALPLPKVVLPPLSEGEAQALPLDGQASLPGAPAVQSASTLSGNMRPVEKPAMDGRAAVAVAPSINVGDRPDGEAEADQVSIAKDEDADRSKTESNELVSVVPTASPIAPPPAVPVPAPEAKSTNASDVKAFAAVTAPRTGSEESIAAKIIPSPSPDAQRAVASEQVGQPSPEAERTHSLSARPAGDVAVRPADPAGIKTEAAAPSSAPAVPFALAPVPVKSVAPVAPPLTTPPIGSPAIKFEIAVDRDARTLPQPTDKSMSQTTNGLPVPAPTPLVADAPAPAKSEALSLLQLVREHFVRREGTSRPTDAASPVPVAHGGDQISAEQAPAEPLIIAPSGPIIASAPTAASGPVQTPSVAVDLGGTITGQVIDMGVQGQWIDGLAKDIASLSANGAQGKFQIRSDHLGAVQVEIRPGATGAAVSLTVASDVAQQALQADGDRLIADAALSAMKITDLRIERGPINEAPRADTAGQQQSGNNSQSQLQHQAQNGSQAMGQGQGQGQGLSQGAGQNRQGQHDNFSGNHKSTPDSAVLSQADAREGESTGARRAASRARYA